MMTWNSHLHTFAQQSAQQKLKCVEVELSAKIEALDKTIKDSERKSNHWRKEADQLRKIERQEEIDYDVRKRERQCFTVVFAINSHFHLSSLMTRTRTRTTTTTLKRQLKRAQKIRTQKTTQWTKTTKKMTRARMTNM